MVRTHTVRPNQSIPDIVLMKYGTMEAFMDFCRVNKISPTVVPAVGTVLDAPLTYVTPEGVTVTIPYDAVVVKYIEKKKLVLGTANVPPELRKFFVIEGLYNEGNLPATLTFNVGTDETANVMVDWGDGTTETATLTGVQVFSHEYTFDPEYGLPYFRAKVYYNEGVSYVEVSSQGEIFNRVFGDLPTHLGHLAITENTFYNSFFGGTLINRCANHLGLLIINYNPTLEAWEEDAAPFATPLPFPELSKIFFNDNKLTTEAIDTLINNYVANAWDLVTPVRIRVDNQVGGGAASAASEDSRNLLIAAGSIVSV